MSTNQELGMKLTDYYYDLPQELIAQDPLKQRDSSRLMVFDRKTKEVTHKVFQALL